MPGLIDLYELHHEHRDRFEILAIHDTTAKTFAELDKELAGTPRRLWHGKDLPFPVLLDATGQTIKAYDINGYPTTLLIDPEGKLVGRGGKEDLESKLPPVPVAERVGRALDCGYSLAVRGLTLEQVAAFLSRRSQIDIHFDPAALAKVGIRPDTPIPLDATGFLTLRGWLDLVCDALGTGCEQDAKGLVITTQRPDNAPYRLSAVQRECARHIEDVLGQKVSVSFAATPLSEACEILEHRSNETFVLDPAARRAGRLDPKTPVAGSARDVPLRDALRQILDPIGLTFAVRGEVVVIGPKR